MGNRSSVTAFAAVATCRDDRGATRLTRLRSDGPLALRSHGSTVFMVGAAAGPLGGDELVLDLDVGAGSSLVMRQSAATLVLPGSRPGWSRTLVRARVGSGATLVFAPEPTIVAAGCQHRLDTELSIAEGGAVSWTERIVLGRENELPEHVVSRLDVEHAGHPFLRHELHLGTATSSSSSAVIGSAKAVGSILDLGPLVRPTPVMLDEKHAALGRYVLAANAALTTATAIDAIALDRILAHSLPHP